MLLSFPVVGSVGNCAVSNYCGATKATGATDGGERNYNPLDDQHDKSKHKRCVSAIKFRSFVLVVPLTVSTCNWNKMRLRYCQNTVFLVVPKITTAPQIMRPKLTKSAKGLTVPMILSSWVQGVSKEMIFNRVVVSMTPPAKVKNKGACTIRQLSGSAYWDPITIITICNGIFAAKNSACFLLRFRFSRGSSSFPASKPNLFNWLIFLMSPFFSFDVSFETEWVRFWKRCCSFIHFRKCLKIVADVYYAWIQQNTDQRSCNLMENIKGQQSYIGLSYLISKSTFVYKPQGPAIHWEVEWKCFWTSQYPRYIKVHLKIKILGVQATWLIKEQLSLPLNVRKLFYQGTDTTTEKFPA